MATVAETELPSPTCSDSSSSTRTAAVTCSSGAGSIVSSHRRHTVAHVVYLTVPAPVGKSENELVLLLCPGKNLVQKKEHGTRRVSYLSSTRRYLTGTIEGVLPPRDLPENDSSH